MDFFPSCFQYLSLLDFNDKIGQNFGNKLKRSKVLVLNFYFLFFYFILILFLFIFFFYSEVLKVPRRDVKFIGLFFFLFFFFTNKNFFPNLLRSVSKALSNKSNAKRNFLFSSMKLKKKKRQQKKPQKYISVFNKLTRQQLLTPAICNWIIVARNRLHVA